MGPAIIASVNPNNFIMTWNGTAGAMLLFSPATGLYSSSFSCWSDDEVEGEIVGMVLRVAMLVVLCYFEGDDEGKGV